MWRERSNPQAKMTKSTLKRHEEQLGAIEDKRGAIEEIDKTGPSHRGEWSGIGGILAQPWSLSIKDEVATEESRTASQANWRKRWRRKKLEKQKEEAM